MRNKVFVLLNSIRSLYNVGSIFRTADAAGVKKLFLCGETGCPPRGQISKTALGAENAVPWEYHQDAAECIAKLRAQGFCIAALENTEGARDLFSFTPAFPLALVVGHEVRGIDPPVLSLCDAVLKIPMRGMKESLNVSVAFGIAAYHLAGRSGGPVKDLIYFPRLVK